VKVKLHENIRKEGRKLGNRSSVPVFEHTQEKLSRLNHLHSSGNNAKKVYSANSSPSKFEQENGNPFDVNLLDMKGNTYYIHLLIHHN
jgi:hypothetical protein